LTDPVLVGDPSIQHGATNCQEGFHGSLPGAHFLAKYNQVADPLLQYFSIGVLVILIPTAKAVALLDCIDEVICVGGSCHRRKGVLLFFSSCRNFKFLRAKKEAQEAFDDEIN
jgi:hypothetical protein